MSRALRKLATTTAMKESQKAEPLAFVGGGDVAGDSARVPCTTVNTGSDGRLLRLASARCCDGRLRRTLPSHVAVAGLVTRRWCSDAVADVVAIAADDDDGALGCATGDAAGDEDAGDDQAK